MLQSLNELTDEINSFLSVQSSAYEGDSADHISSLCTSVIIPLVNSAKSKIGKLDSALPYIKEINDSNDKIEGYRRIMHNLSNSVIDQWQKQIYNNLIIAEYQKISDNSKTINGILK